MTTRELEHELGELYQRIAFVDVDHPEDTDRQLAQLGPRWLRVARELARRDYRFREHGRTCTCADCMRLLEEWTDLQRRGDHDLAP